MSGAGAGEPLHPSEGARFLLERAEVADEGARARYRAAIYTPDARFDYTADLGLDGSAEVTAAGDPAGEPLEKMLYMIARLTARGAASRREDGLAPWPQRVLRWRGPGR